MKVLILGNSNSILKDGWVTHLKCSKPKYEFVNLSVGGSPSPALLMQCLMNINKLDDVDVAIIEPTVIDHGEGWQNPSQIAKHAQYLISFLVERSIKILLLVLPRNEEAIIKETNGMVAWSQVAVKNGVSVVNGNELIKKYSLFSKIQINLCWRDNRGHPTAECQKFIGEHIAPYLDCIKASAVMFSPTENFSLLNAIKLNGTSASVRLIDRGNSYLQYKCCQMTANSSLQFYLPDEMVVHGLLINYGEMTPNVSTLIEFETEFGFETVDISNKFLAGEASRKFVCLYRAVKPIKKCFAIRLSKTDENARFSEENDERLEIAGILLGPQLPNLEFKLINSRI